MKTRTTPTEGLLRIGQVAHRAEVSTDTLRYYERISLVEPAKRSPGGYRLYTPDAIARLSFIRKAQALGLSLEEVAEIVAAADGGEAPCGQVRRALRARLDELDRRIAKLKALRRDLVGALERSSGDSPGEAHVCGIIESVAETRGDPSRLQPEMGHEDAIVHALPGL